MVQNTVLYVRRCKKEVSVKNLSYLFAAYTIIWVVLFGYILSLSRKNRELGREIVALKERLPEK